MPCIQLFTNQSVDIDKQEVLKADFGKAIEAIPGKTEKWLMCVFCPACGMWFQGEQKDAVYMEVSLYGQAEGEVCNQLTEQLAQIIHKELGVQFENIYIKYSMTPYWGWNGSNFGRQKN